MTLHFKGRSKQHGFSLVELLVTIIIALLASLAVFGVLSTFEGKKRTTTSVNDVVQSGNFGLFYVDKLLRNAGTGFASSFGASYGCVLNFKNATGTTATIPATDFPSLSTTITANGLEMAPVLIKSGGSTSSDGSTITHFSDAIIIMGGASGNAEYPTSLSAQPSLATSLPAINTVPFQASDLLLLTDQPGTAPAVMTPCLMSQVATTYSATQVGAVPAVPLPLGGQFYTASQGSSAVVTYSKSAQIIDFGSPTSDSPPTFDVIGVNSNHTLIDYSILNQTGTSNQISDGVFEMHALYGVDLANSGVITWEDPSQDPWTFTDLNSHTVGLPTSPPTGAYALERIRAIKVGFILRTELPERLTQAQINAGQTAITAGPLVLFASTPVPYSRTLTGAELLYRYRTVEVTVPIRNNLLVAK